MKILHLLASGGVGGIERLCEDLAQTSHNDNYFAFLFEEGEIYERLKKLKKHRVISLIHLSSRTHKIVKTLNEYIKRQKIDIIIVHHGGLKCNIIYLKLLKNNNIKSIRYLHGCYDNYSWGRGNNYFKNIVVDAVMQKALKKSNIVICISEASKKSFVNKFNIEETKIKVIYNGINESFYNNLPKRDFSSNMLKFIYVGRLEYLKGLDFFFDALAECKDKIKFSLDIVGDGNHKDSLIKKSENLGIDSNITFYGRQRNIIKYLDENEFFIYPSICEEGFGISVAEAMSRGCIPFVANKGGLPEVVNNDQDLIFKNQTDKKKKIINLYNLTPKERKKISSFYLNYSKKFCISKSIKKLDDLFNSF